MIYKGLQLKVKDNHGYFRSATVLDPVDLSHSEECLWWVQYSVDDNTEVTVVSENDLINWNRVFHCVCGSEKVGISNRHSYWCAKYEKFRV